MAAAKLLCFLQEKEYRPLGVRRSVIANVRVIAAANTDLARAVDDGWFRKDLFFRINVLPLRLPAAQQGATRGNFETRKPKKGPKILSRQKPRFHLWPSGAARFPELKRGAPGLRHPFGRMKKFPVISSKRNFMHEL